MNLKTNYMGLELKNPIIIGSSGLTNSVAKIKELEKNQAGAVVLKSLFEEQILMEISQNFSKNTYSYPSAYDYLNNYTKQAGIDKYLTLIEEAKESVNIPIIASINCATTHEWVSFTKNIQSAGADALEINISLLPSDTKIKSSEYEEKYFKIVENVSKVISIPVALKMNSYSAGLANLIQKLSWTNFVDAFVLFNRHYSPDIDIDTLKVKSANQLSTPDEISNSLRWIALLSGKITKNISASTGVHDHEGLIKQLLVGSQAVQIVSTVYKNSNKIIPQILEGLKQWMQKHNYTNIDDFRGKLNYAQIENPTFFERIQFMKYFGEYKQ